jgi:ALG6, ALG8 glycosyltransferase family
VLRAVHAAAAPLPPQSAPLRQVSPAFCALCVAAAMLPCLVALWRRPRSASLVRAAAYAALCGFVFGFHVHEKAAVTVTVLLALEADLTRAKCGCRSRVQKHAAGAPMQCYSAAVPCCAALRCVAESGLRV